MFEDTLLKTLCSRSPPFSNQKFESSLSVLSQFVHSLLVYLRNGDLFTRWPPAAELCQFLSDLIGNRDSEAKKIADCAHGPPFIIYSYRLPEN